MRSCASSSSTAAACNVAPRRDVALALVRERERSMPAMLLDPKAGPLIAVKLHLLTRKTLGGIETDLSARALADSGQPVPKLYAAGDAAGFGGGMHGYRSLEGTRLGGCLFTARTAGRAVANAL
jgi:predicted oxidoreductase